MLVEREPEWNDEQRALVQAAEDYERNLADHGQPFDEATSSLADPNNAFGQYFYRAGIPVTTPEGAQVFAPLVDFAKKAQLDAEETLRKAAGDGANLNGLVFPVTRIDRNPPG